MSVLYIFMTMLKTMKVRWPWLAPHATDRKKLNMICTQTIYVSVSYTRSPHHKSLKTDTLVPKAKLDNCLLRALHAVQMGLLYEVSQRVNTGTSSNSSHANRALQAV